MRAALSEALANRVTTPVRFRGRLYPQVPDAPRKAVTELQDRSPRDAIRAELSAEIIRRLPFLNESQAGTTMQRTQAFQKSYDTILGFYADVEALVPLLCRANLEFRQESGETFTEAKAEVMQRKLAAMIEKTRLRIRPIANPVNAHLLALPPDAAEEKLRSSLRQSVDRFVQDFFDSLDHLVDKEVCGLVEWTSQNTCCYHFFREVVIQDREETRTELGASYLDRKTHGIRYQEADEVESGTHTHRLARHEYHTGDAFQTRIADTKVVLPPAVQELVAAIPDWLEPVVRIIDGTLVRALIIERDIETETWESRKPLDRLVFKYEPGVVIDHIVLTGWGPREIDAELERRSAEQRAEQSRKRTTARPYWLAGAGVLSFLSLAWHWNSSGSADFVIAFLLVVAAGCCGLMALTLHAEAEERQFAFAQPYLAGFGLLLALSGTGLVFALGFGAGMLVLLPLAFAVLGAILVSLPWFRPSNT